MTYVSADTLTILFFAGVEIDIAIPSNPILLMDKLSQMQFIKMQLSAVL